MAFVLRLSLRYADWIAKGMVKEYYNLNIAENLTRYVSLLLIVLIFL